MELKEKLKKRKKVFGCWTSTGNESVVEMFLYSKFDFLGIDLEHSTIDLNQTKNLISICEKYKVPCLPRVPSIDSSLIRRILDAGASGIIVPSVETEGDVKKIIEIMKYPPMGKRGYGISKASTFGNNFNKYIGNWNKKSILVIQIENLRGVNNLKKILLHKEIDAVMIGPYDLSGSLGKPGNFKSKIFKNLTKKIIKECQNSKTSVGIHEVDPSKKNVSKLIKSGYNFMVLSSDIFLLLDWTRNISKTLSFFKSKK